MYIGLKALFFLFFNCLFSKTAAVHNMEGQWLSLITIPINTSNDNCKLFHKVKYQQYLLHPSPPFPLLYLVLPLRSSYDSILRCGLLVRSSWGEEWESLAYAAHVIPWMSGFIVILFCLISVAARHHVLHFFRHFCALENNFPFWAFWAVCRVARSTAGCCLFGPSGCDMSPCPSVGPWCTTNTSRNDIPLGRFLLMSWQSGLLYHAAQSFLT